MAEPIRIIIEELKPKRTHFAARLEKGRVLIASTRCPLLESARLLLAEGHDPETRLELWHKGAASMTGLLGKLARLTVDEGTTGPVFRRIALETSADPSREPSSASPAAISGSDEALGHPTPIQAKSPSSSLLSRPLT